MFTGRVVEATAETMDYAMFPELNPLTQNYVMEQLQAVIPAMSDIARSMVEKTRNVYEAVTNSTVVQRAKAAMRMAVGLRSPHSVAPLTELEDLQCATITEQRFIMANPEVRALYHQQRCDGFSNTYVDLEPDAIGEAQYDYRRMMHGVVIDTPADEGDDEGSFKVKFYLDELHDGDKQPSFDEQAFHIRNGEAVASFLRAGKDATDSFGN